MAEIPAHGHELSIGGDTLIMNKPTHPLSKTLSPPSSGEVGGMYQNVDFMRTDNSKRYFLFLQTSHIGKGPSVDALNESNQSSFVALPLTNQMTIEPTMILLCFV
jgi:hypothetical protein